MWSAWHVSCWNHNNILPTCSKIWYGKQYVTAFWLSCPQMYLKFLFCQQVETNSCLFPVAYFCYTMSSCSMQGMCKRHLENENSIIWSFTIMALQYITTQGLCHFLCSTCGREEDCLSGQFNLLDLYAKHNALECPWNWYFDQKSKMSWFCTGNE